METQPQHLAGNSLLGELIKNTTPIQNTAVLAKSSDGSIIGIEGFTANLQLTKPWETKSKVIPANQSIYYKMDEGIGNVLHDSFGGGPDIQIPGNLANIWDTPGCLTFDALGNPMQVAGNSYVDSLLDMDNFGGSIIIAFDVHMNSWPTVSESLWSIWKPGSAYGGIRCAAPSFTYGALNTYVTVPAAAEFDVFVNRDSIPGVTHSIVVDIDCSLVASHGRLYTTMYRDGICIRTNCIVATSMPKFESAGGFWIGAYSNGAGALGKAGTGTGGGTKLSNLFIMKTAKHDARTAFYLADYIYSRTDSSLPTELRSL